MPAGLAEHLLHQLRGAVGDLGLVGKRGRTVDEHAELHDPLDPVERAERGLDLREKHDAAAARGRDPAIEVSVLAEAAFDQAAVLGETDLAGDVEEPTLLDGGYIGRHRSGRLWQNDSEFGEALVDAHGLAPSTPRP